MNAERVAVILAVALAVPALATTVSRLDGPKLSQMSQVSVRQDGSPRGPGPPPRALCVVGWGAGQNDAATSEAEPNRLVLLGGLRRSLAKIQQPVSTLRAYLARAVTLSDAELAAIDRGRPVGKALPSRNSAEIFVLGAIYVRASADAYLARALDPNQLLTLPGYRGTGLIGDPPEASSFGGFTLEPDDIDDLKDCRPGDCAVQFPAAVIPDIRAAARSSDPSTAAVLTNNRTRLLAIDLVRQYRERGNAALPIYNDEGRPAPVADQFRSLMQRLAASALAPPDVSRLMLDYPNAGAVPPDVKSIFYWEKVVFGLKPTLRVTHAMAYRPKSPSPLGCVVAIKQLYASHYLRSAIDFAACLDALDRTGRPGFYLVAFKGSRQEGVTGLGGSLVRRVVVSRARTALDGSLVRIKAALEGASRK